jgi:hypothetical protein
MDSPRRRDIDGALAKYRAAAQQARATIGVAAPSARYTSALASQPQQPPQLPQSLPQQPQPLPLPLPQQPPTQHTAQYAEDAPSAGTALSAPASDKVEQRLARLEQLYEQERSHRVELQKQLEESDQKGEEAEESIDQLVQLASELHARQTEQNQRVAKIEGATLGADSAGANSSWLAAQWTEMQAQLAEQLERKFAEERDVYIKLLEASELTASVNSELRLLKNTVDAMRKQQNLDGGGGGTDGTGGGGAGVPHEGRQEPPRSQLVRGRSEIMSPSRSTEQPITVGPRDAPTGEMGLAANETSPVARPADRQAIVQPHSVRSAQMERVDALRVDQAPEVRPSMQAAVTKSHLDDDDDEEQRLLQEDIEVGATTVIQAAWRGKAVRKRDLLPHKQPSQVQPVEAQHLVVAPATQTRVDTVSYDSTSSDEEDSDPQRWEEEQRAAQRYLAATDLQAAWRGHLVRAQMKPAADVGAAVLPQRVISRERVDSLQLTREHLRYDSENPVGTAAAAAAAAPAPAAAVVPAIFRPHSSPSPSNLSLEEWDDGLGDDSLMNDEKTRALGQAFGDMNSWGTGGVETGGSVAKLAAAALNDDDCGTESDDSTTYDPPPGPPHIPASQLNDAQPPIEAWEHLALERERRMNLQFDVDGLEQVRMISPREDAGHEFDDSSLLSSASFDDGLGPDSPELHQRDAHTSDEHSAVAAIVIQTAYRGHGVRKQGLLDSPERPAGPVSPPPRAESDHIKLTTVAKGRAHTSGRGKPARGRALRGADVAAPSTPPPRDSPTVVTSGTGQADSVVAAGAGGIATAFAENELFRKQREAANRAEEKATRKRLESEAIVAREVAEDAWDAWDAEGQLDYKNTQTGATSRDPFADSQSQSPPLPAGVRYNPESRWELLYTESTRNRTGDPYYVQQPLPGDDTSELLTQWEAPPEGVNGFGEFDEDD